MEGFSSTLSNEQLEKEVAISMDKIKDIVDPNELKRWIEYHLREELKLRMDPDLKNQLLLVGKLQERIKHLEEEKNKSEKEIKKLCSLFLLRNWLEDYELQFELLGELDKKRIMIRKLKYCKVDSSGYSNNSMVSVHYIRWLYFLHLSKTSLASDIKRCLKYEEMTIEDLARQVARIYSATSNNIYHLNICLTKDEIITGIKAYGLHDKHVLKMVNVLTNHRYSENLSAAPTPDPRKNDPDHSSATVCENPTSAAPSEEKLLNSDSLAPHSDFESHRKDKKRVDKESRKRPPEDRRISRERRSSSSERLPSSSERRPSSRYSKNNRLSYNPRRSFNRYSITHIPNKIRIYRL